MTEAEWLGCGDPERMLEFVRGRAGERKLGLFGCACCRRVWHLIEDERSRAAVELRERRADGSASEEELRAASEHARQALQETAHAVARGLGDPTATSPDSPDARGALGARLSAARAAVPVTDPGSAGAASAGGVARTSSDVADAVRCLDPADGVAAYARERAAHCDLLREIAGPLPFRPVSFSPEWRTDTALTLARQMYGSRDFSAMPILADALQDAGCDRDDVLDHCREPGPHVRGCWVVDLVSGKQ